MNVLSGQLATTTACFTEAKYLLGKSAGFGGQMALWDSQQAGDLVVFDQDQADLVAVRKYMVKYRDVPCDFADATLLVLVERLGTNQVFTLDRHFYVYRLKGTPIDVIPAGALPPTG